MARLFDRLSFRQARNTVIVAVLLGIFASALDLVDDARREREVQRRTLEEVTQIIAEAAAKAAYDLDSSLASDVLKGLLSYQPIFQARIQDEFGARLAVRERPLMETRLRLFSEWLFGRSLDITVPLYYEPVNRPRLEIGKLYVAVDSHIVATAFLERARSTLISGLFRNLVLGLLLTAMFHFMVTKPILAISKDFTRIDAQSPGSHLVEVPPGHDADELGLLVGRTNQFLKAFDASLRERARYADELRGALIRAEEGSRAKSQFLSTMSHELRTPLNAIIGFSELIRDDPASVAKGAALGDYAREIHGSGNQLLQIINDLLDLTEIDAGRHAINPETLDVRHMLEACARHVSATARERNLSLTVGIDAGCPALRADPRAARQILLNVLSNALKFTPEGGRVTVKAAALGDRVVLTVADSGIGIDPANLPRVCEPFWQAEPVLSRRYGGTGLGMPLVQALVDLHDGALRIVSGVGEGTTVTIELPAAIADRPVSAARA
ncbi:sensor histidine kinase [Skermanella pratensis]|uniref:sensor histidine kinase n=1 Tax=Skermanella pratensis TaxID=2233999 RepID=UPI001300E248|nr:HAMP domain-containing sensor histidine kinase [Skermanella pratensis]